MKRLSVLFLLILSMSTTDLFGQGPPFLSEYQWNNRVILLFEGEQDRSGMFAKQMSAILSQHRELEDRDIIFFQFTGNEGAGPGFGPRTPRIFAEQMELLRQHYAVSPQEFTVILVGKDGSEKIRKTNQFLSMQELFTLIDGMPMRQQEIRDRNRP